MGMGFEEFERIFGEPKVEWVKNSDTGSAPFGPFLMHVFAPDENHLKIHVTDYHSNTFEAVKSVLQLEEMRDYIGIGGSWSEFVNYIVASIKSEDVKLVLEKHSDLGVAHAKLVAQKSKGMPLISFSLAKIVDSAASDAMANLSRELFKSLKYMHSLVTQEQDHRLQLTKAITAGKERNETIQSQVEKRQKLEKMNSSDTVDVSAPLASHGSRDSPDKQATRDTTSTKVAQRVVPAFRRAKVRGALLQDTDNDKNN